MLVRKIFSLIILLYCFNIFSEVRQDNPSCDWYILGRERLDQGDWRGALHLWLVGYDSLRKDSKVDPRIGVGYIELATEKMAGSYYDKGSIIYMWGFSGESLEHNDVVLKEAERILPLLSEEEKKKWKGLIKRKDSGMWRLIRKYWLERDPRPTTEVNERLIEHWRRIAYARRHFTKNRSGAYGCDDRGTIYVKYGEPDRKMSGRFGTSSIANSELNIWAPVILAGLQGGTRSYGRSPFSSGNMTLSPDLTKNKIVTLVKVFDPKPDYEVWAYDNLDTRKPCIFLFSRRDGVGRFGLVSGVEDVYPKERRIFTPTDLKNMPRDYIVYQLLYYAELSTFDDFFYTRFRHITSVWNSMEDRIRRGGVAYAFTESGFINVLHSIEKTHDLNDKFNPVRKYAEPEKSGFETNFGSVAISAQSVRLLDGSNRPVVSIIAHCVIDMSGCHLLRSGLVDEISDYNVTTTLITRDEDLSELNRFVKNRSGKDEILSFFTITHDQKFCNATIAVEAKDSIERVLSLGRRSFEISSPLDSSPDNLELSDLVIGFNLGGGLEAGEYPFPVLPSDEFTRKDGFEFYVEIYHLMSDRSGLYRYEVEYGVTEIKRKRDRVIRRDRISMFYDRVGRGERSSEFFGIDISRLGPGEYELFVKVKDLVSGQSRTRKEIFRIKKS